MKLPFSSPFVFDGSFGTYYASLYPSASPCEYANTEHPERVTSIHREYINAGANAVKTNTFTLNSSNVPEPAKLEALVKGALSCAFDAANGRAEVFADIGPIRNGSDSDYEALAEIFIRNGAKNFLFETFAEFEPLVGVLSYIKNKVSDSVIIVSFAASPDGYTRHGFSLASLLYEAANNEATDAVGFNCVCGPSHAANLAEALSSTKKPLCVMPNAGYPTNENGRTVYNDNVSYFAEKLSRIYSAGAKIIGGCCGTTPAHIAASVSAIAQHSFSSAPSADTEKTLLDCSENPFATKLSSTEKVIAVELDPPATADFSKILSAARELKSAGCDAVTFADNPLSRARADSFTTAAYVSTRVGISVIPHLTCRDRNHIAIKSSLLAANAIGVQNLLAVTGDPLSGETGKSVFALNSFKLIGYVSSLNKSEFSNAPFFIGGALNLNATNFSAELTRAEKKIANGAGFFLTQPVASERSLENLRTAHKALSAPILAGLFPVAGYKNALFLKNEVSGMDIPDSLLEALEGKSREEAALVSVSFAAKLAEKASPYCNGFYIMTPLNRTDIVTSLICKLKELKLV